MTHWKSETLTDGVHAIVGGAGPPVVLLPGWPQTAAAYEDVFPALAAHHTVLCLDPPGLGDSAPPAGGYDTAAVSAILDRAVGARADGPVHLVGHDIGCWIAYAWAAQFPGRLRSLTLLDAALPGLAPPQPFPLPPDVNVKLWQFSFCTLPELPEILTAGHERELFDWLFRHKAAHPDRISPAHRDRYVDCYSRPGAMGRGFDYYRAAAASGAQNVEFAKAPLPMPVLALGGSIAMGPAIRTLAQRLATDVEGGVIDDCGHYLMEEQPAAVAERLLGFFRRTEGTDR